MKHDFSLKTIIIILIQAIIITDIAWAQNYVPTAIPGTCLAVKINIPEQNFQNMFLKISVAENPQIYKKQLLKTVLIHKKYPLILSLILGYETIDLFSQVITLSSPTNLAVSSGIMYGAMLLLLINKFSLFSPEAFLEVLSIEKIMSEETKANSFLIRSNLDKTAIAAVFLAKAQNSDLEWGLSVAKQGKNILNLISKGDRMWVKHSFLAHLALSSRKTKTIASLHTHPFDNAQNHLNSFPSPDDFERLRQIPREKSSDNYLLAFTDTRSPVLVKYQLSSQGNNLVTHFVFGEKNIIAVLADVFEGKNFAVIRQENPQAITGFPVEIIFGRNNFGQYFSTFSCPDASDPQLISLLYGNKKNTKNPARQSFIPPEQKLEKPQSSNLQIIPLPYFQRLNPDWQLLLDFSV